MRVIKIILIIVLLVPKLADAQEFSGSNLTSGIALGINEGHWETGMGAMVAIGYQKSYWNDRFRLNPAIMAGGFIPFGITDTRDQYYRLTSLGVNGYIDVIKLRPLSLYAGAGGALNYSRGLLGTGGWPEAGNNSSEYFFNLYYSGYIGAGIRLSPANWKFAYTFSPVNICFGNDYFLLSYLKVGIEYKLGIAGNR